MEVLAGKVVKYYRAIEVASVEVSDNIEAGDRIHIKGHTTDFDQTIKSMQIRHRRITAALKGQVIGIKVDDYVRKHDLVYRII